MLLLVHHPITAELTIVWICVGGWWWDDGGIAVWAKELWESLEGETGPGSLGMDCSLSRIPLTTRAFPRNQTITGCHLSAVLVKFVIIALSVINYNVSTNKDHFLRLSDFKYYLVGPAHPLVASSHLMIKANQWRFTMTIVGTNGNVSMVGNFMAPFLAISGPTHLHPLFC